MPRRPPPSRLIGSGLIPSTYDEQYNQAEQEYQAMLAETGRDERSLFQDYGFRGGVGAGGEVNFEVDPTNQFGNYQSLLRSIGGSLGAARTEARGRGIGRAGLAKARENLVRHMLSGEKASLVGGFNKAAAGLFGRRGQAMTGRNRRFSELEGAALDWWNQYGPEDPDQQDVVQGGPPNPILGGQAPIDYGTDIPSRPYENVLPGETAYEEQPRGYAPESVWYAPSGPTQQQPLPRRGVGNRQHQYL